MKEIRERVIELRNELEQTQEVFATNHGLTRSQLSQIEIGHNKSPIEFLASLVNKCGVRWEWLIEGKLPKFTSEIISASSTPPVNNPGKNNKTQPAYPIKHFGLPVIATVDEGGSDNIVMVDIKAAAGYAQNFTEPKFITKLPAMKLHGSEFRNGIFRGYQIEGDSMYDTLDHNDWVVGRYCDNHWQDIKEGYIHVLVTKSDVTVKRLLNRVEERGKIVLLSDNEQYPTRDIDVEEVQEIWVVKARLTYNLRSRRIDWFKKYNDVQAEMVDIKDRLVRLERAGKLK